MKKITLSNGMVALVSDKDFKHVSLFNWHFHKAGYAMRNDWNGGRHSGQTMHRLVMSPPKGKSVDHKNGNRLDNRRSNLRICDHVQNCWNAKLSKANKTGFKGVDWYAKRKTFRAQIMVRGRLFHIGCYKTAEEAGRAYDKAAIKYFGKFANPNKKIHERTRKTK